MNVEYINIFNKYWYRTMLDYKFDYRHPRSPLPPLFMSFSVAGASRHSHDHHD